VVGAIGTHTIRAVALHYTVRMDSSSGLRYITTHDGRQVFTLFAESLDAFPEQLTLPGPYFTCLFVCAEEPWSGEGIERVANILLDAGLVYLCAWGFLSGAVHIIFDLAIARREIDKEHVSVTPGDSPVIMTTDHENDSLDEALWYALWVALPHDAFFEEWDTIVAITVGNREWADQIEQRLSSLEQLDADVVGY
jgi:hypothetical protein